MQDSVNTANFPVNILQETFSKCLNVTECSLPDLQICNHYFLHGMLERKPTIKDKLQIFQDKLLYVMRGIFKRCKVYLEAGCQHFRIPLRSPGMLNCHLKNGLLNSQQIFSSALFNDIVNCYNYTVSVIDGNEYEALLE